MLETDPDFAASRAYYAAFHALTTLFALRGQAFSKHTAIRAALHRDLVHTGEWEAQLGRSYDFLMDLRETGDYGGPVHVTTADAATAIEKARTIVAAVQDTCPGLGGTAE